MAGSDGAVEIDGVWGEEDTQAHQRMLDSEAELQAKVRVLR